MVRVLVFGVMMAAALASCENKTEAISPEEMARQLAERALRDMAPTPSAGTKINAPNSTGIGSANPPVCIKLFCMSAELIAIVAVGVSVLSVMLGALVPMLLSMNSRMQSLGERVARIETILSQNPPESARSTPED